MRLKLVVAYVGTRYSGWQIQDRPQGPPTVQGVLEAALRRLCCTPVRVHGAGRTDAGVHAHGQVAHCDVPDTRAGLDWRHSCNALLPADIRIVRSDTAAPDFHARKHALCKTYEYLFWTERAFVPPQIAPYVWACGPLDVDAMRAALPFLTGRHDFASLRNAGTDVQSSLRTLLRASVEALPPLPHYAPHAPLLRLSVTADGFLKQMVRNMAGLLADCGRGRLRAGDIPRMLEARERQAVPSMTAPPQGLTLARILHAPAAHPRPLKPSAAGLP